MPAPIVVFGAFDRHNFGDLLFAHVAESLLPGRQLHFAGLAARDLRPLGGHLVQAVHRLAADPALRSAHLLHAGGELLTCRARQAAVMLLPPQEVDATLAYLDRHPADEPAWRQALLGTSMALPYVMPREAWPVPGRIVFDAVGGADLPALPEGERLEVLARLRAADCVSVRDAVTQSALQAAGIQATLLPDPAVLVQALFADRIHARLSEPAMAQVLAACPAGHVAVQLSAEFADDRTLELAAAQLHAALAPTPFTAVLLRAGAAAWHDDLGLLQRLADRLAPGRVRVFESLHLWDTCALLATARAFAGSSLHGLVVASAFGVPAAVVAKPASDPQAGKLAAYAGTWHTGGPPVVRPLAALGQGLAQALDADSAALRRQAGQRADAYRCGFGRLRAVLEGDAMSHGGGGETTGC